MFPAFRTPLLLPSYNCTQLRGSWTTSESAISNIDSADAGISVRIRGANFLRGEFWYIYDVCK